MDVLRLLSRSTKPTNKALGKSSTPLNLPSAGNSTNPQLFHDAIPESRGKKRKRGTEKAEEQTQVLDEDTIDFFSPKSLVSKPKVTSAAAQTTGNSKPQGKYPQDASKLLDEDECRQILRSHRLKITLLPSVNAQNKKIKKLKKEKLSKKASSKEEYKQVYPQPLQAFGDLRTIYGISGRMAENLASQGYKIPTEVQMGSLPLLLQPKTALGSSAKELGAYEDGVDLLAVAPTGSGKTLAFLIPVVNQIIQQRRVSKDKGDHSFEAVIVAPTKELASQIVNEAKKLCLGTGVKVVGMRKGLQVVSGESSAEVEPDESDESEEETEERPQRASTQPLAKADILITTPGLLLSAISVVGTDNRTPLPTIRTLVLDEADVLLDPLFRDQTLGIWDSCTNPSLRVTLWSATMGSNIETLASTTIHARRAKLALSSTSRTIRLVVGLKDSAIPNITHRLIYAASEAGKRIAIRQLLHPTSHTSESLRPPFLVFTQTIPRAIALHSELLYDIPSEAGGSSRIAVLHSDLSDSARDHVMNRFRAGEIWVLITTDLLSRGVDFRGINGVVNYDVPNSGAAYIHRVGRTGRAGRDGGVAVTFYTEEDIEFVRDVANIIVASERAAGKEESDVARLLASFPKVSKEKKKNFKKFGNEARRGGLGNGKEGNEAKGKKGRMMISTKSGYERKLENNRRGAIEGSRRRMREALVGEEEGEKTGGEDSEWGGLDD
jgi:ATP-dependent RNA helicase DDX52/ROK1